jgi:trans-aconitate methyltransferase
MRWNAQRYDSSFGFVTVHGTQVLDLLELSPPASVVDVGCGTGVHAAELSRRGFEVTGVDSDPAMLARARELHPEVRFLAADAQCLRMDGTFDAAFSNAALHWMTDQGAALRSIRAVLRDGGPFVAEMGGKHNVATVDAALEAATASLEVPPIRKFFPSVAEEAALLEASGFDVELMQWFSRPTPLAAGQTPADWTRVFRANVWDAVPEDQRAKVAASVDAGCDALRTDDGWSIDYWRLRFVARAVS